MKAVTSVSGGKTSAYLAANYPSDYNVFALVRIEDERCRWMRGRDEQTRRLIEDRIQKPFIATAEEDEIIYTILDLEQYIGREIKIVSGITYDEVIKMKGGYLPNKVQRYCTTYMKVIPIFEWWLSEIGEPVEMRIGYRANETRRVQNMRSKLNADGLIEMEYSLEKWVGGAHDGKNKWEMIPWQKPVFPLVDDLIYKDQVELFWSGKPVRFAERNNCVGCFHRNPMLLNLISQKQPEKMSWFAEKEGGDNGFWRSDCSYRQIINYKPQLSLNFEDFGSGDDDCEDGYCGV